MKKQKRQLKLFSRPSSSSITLLFILSVIYVPTLLPLMENKAGIQLFLAILFAPLLIIIPLVSYKVGISLRYFDPEKNKTNACAKLIGLCAAIVIASIILEIMYSGYPIRICFDTCIKIDTVKVFFDFLVCTLVLTAPAWIGIARYDSYDFPRGTKK